MRPIGHADELERRRRRAVQLFEAGESPTEIAKFLDCERQSVHRWERAARAGPNGLDAKPHPGRPRALDDEKLRQLEQLLLQGPLVHGFSTQLWTGARIAQVIDKAFGVQFTADYCVRLAKKKLGWSCQKPERKARERDEAAIQQWKEEDWPRIKKSSA